MIVNSRSFSGGALLPIAIIAYWAVGFYPFQWFSPFAAHENVLEKTAAGGLSFPGRGIAFSETAPAWVSTAIEDNSFAVALEVRSYDTRQTGPARIFTVSKDHDHRNFTVGQSGRDLVVRLRTTATGPNGTPDYLISEVFGNATPRRIVVRVKPHEIRIEVNGRQRLVSALPPSALATWDLDYRLALGAEFTFQRPWRGELKRAVVRVRDRQFSYTAANLRTPHTYRLSVESLRDRAHDFMSGSLQDVNAVDWIINLVGFAPFGFVLARVGRRTASVMLVCAGCAALSLSIEVGQFFFETRNPQAVDLVLNILGGGIGAWLSISLALRHRPQKKTVA